MRAGLRAKASLMQRIGRMSALEMNGRGPFGFEVSIYRVDVSNQM